MSDPTNEVRRSEKFWWFDSETVQKLCEQLNAAGPDARLEVHPEGRKLWLHVFSSVDAAGNVTAFQPLNKSWECPPICP